MTAILMISAKLANSDILEIKIFQNKNYNVKISVHDVTSKNLSHDSNYIIDVVMCQNFGNCSISEIRKKSFSPFLNLVTSSF